MQSVYEFMRQQLLDNSNGLKNIPKTKISMALCDKNADEAIQNLYKNFLSQIVYWQSYLYWGTHISKQKILAIPDVSDSIQSQFVIDTSEQTISLINSNTFLWIKNQIVADLIDRFNVYIDNYFDLALRISLHNKPLTAEKIMENLNFEENFYQSKMQQKLKILRDEIKTETPFTEELISLSKARHIISHHASIIPKKYCPHGIFKITYRESLLEVFSKTKRKWVRLTKDLFPISGHEYPQSRVTFGKITKNIKFDTGSKLDFSEKEVSELINFILLCLQDYHLGLLKLAEQKNIKLKDFKEYSVSMRMEFVLDKNVK